MEILYIYEYVSVKWNRNKKFFHSGEGLLYAHSLSDGVNFFVFSPIFVRVAHLLVFTTVFDHYYNV